MLIKALSIHQLKGRKYAHKMRVEGHTPSVPCPRGYCLQPAGVPCIGQGGEVRKEVHWDRALLQKAKDKGQPVLTTTPQEGLNPLRLAPVEKTEENL